MSSANGVDGYHGRSGKSTGDPERDRLLQQVMKNGREFGLVLISLNAATARAIDTHPTDAWILSYLQALPPDARLTPGELARVTCLTTGAITGVIDRLERDEYVRRERDPTDRRKVIIVPTERSANVARIFQPMVEAYLELCLKYSTEELATISSYFEASIAIAEATIARMRQA